MPPLFFRAQQVKRVARSTNGVPDFTPYSRGPVVQIEVDVAARRGVKGKASDDHFRKIDYKAASKALWEKIESNPDLRKQLNLDDDAIEGLKKGYKPDGFTWHHVGHTLNSDGKGSMMLVEQVPHDLFRHKGWFSFLKNGLI